MGEISSRPASAADAAQIAGLIQAVAEAAGRRPSVSASDIALEFAQPSWDPTVDSRVIEEDGRLIAYGSLTPPAAGGTRVGADEYVQAQRHGERRALLVWQIERTNELHAADSLGKPWSLIIEGSSEHAGSDELLEELGFEPIRHSFYMERSTAARSPEVEAPVGLVVRSYSSVDEPAVYQVHNDAYADRWDLNLGPSTTGPEEWLTPPFGQTRAS